MSTTDLRPAPTRRRCCAATSGTRCATRLDRRCSIGMPLVFLLLFVYVFGGTLGAGLGGAAGGRGDYVDYVTPGILLITVAGAAPGHRRSRSPWT